MHLWSLSIVQEINCSLDQDKVFPPKGESWEEVSSYSSYPGVTLAFCTPFQSPFPRQRKCENLQRPPTLLSSSQCLLSNEMADVFTLVVSEQFGKWHSSCLWCLPMNKPLFPFVGWSPKKELKLSDVEHVSFIRMWWCLSLLHLWYCVTLRFQQNGWLFFQTQYWCLSSKGKNLRLWIILYVALGSLMKIFYVFRFHFNNSQNFILMFFHKWM
jgi:hypothetical protein